MNIPYQLASNTGRMILASACRKILTFLQFFLIARFTSVEDTANYLFLMSIAAVIISLIDFGFSPTLIREGSKSTESLSRYLNNTLGIKLLLSLSTGLFGAMLVTVLNYPTLTRQLVYLTIAALLFESFAETFYGCLRVHFRMKYEARGIVFGQCLNLLVVSIAIALELSLHFLVGGYLLAQLFNFLYSLFQLNKQLHLVPKITFEARLIRRFSVIAFPILVAFLFERILSTDVFILNFMSNKQAVALFSIPAMIIASLIFIPQAFGDVIYPAFSSFHEMSTEKLARTFEVSFRTLLYISFPLSFGIIVLSRDLLLIGFGTRYIDATPILRLLALSLIPLFLAFPIRALLNACNRQVTNTMLMILASAVHLSLTYLLIPVYGAIGIAWAGLIGNLLFFFLGISSAYRLIGYRIKKCIFDVAKVSLSTLVMSVILIGMKNHLTVFIVVPLVGSLYFLCLFLLRGYSRNGFSWKQGLGEWLGSMGQE